MGGDETIDKGDHDQGLDHLVILRVNEPFQWGGIDIKDIAEEDDARPRVKKDFKSLGCAIAGIGGDED